MNAEYLSLDLDEKPGGPASKSRAAFRLPEETGGVCR